mgnify:CR=1 FL=1
MNCCFARLCCKHISSYTNNITNIRKLFKHGVVKGFIFFGTGLVLLVLIVYAMTSRLGH